jgi:hypothetical protein
MELDQYLENDILVFLDSKISKKEKNSVDREEEYGLYLTRDYLKEIKNALSNDEINKGKKIFDELKETYNRLPKSSLERKKIYSILEKMYTEIQNYVGLKDSKIVINQTFQQDNEAFSMASKTMQPGISKLSIDTQPSEKYNKNIPFFQTDEPKPEDIIDTKPVKAAQEVLPIKKSPLKDESKAKNHADDSNNERIKAADAESKIKTHDMNHHSKFVDTKISEIEQQIQHIEVKISYSKDKLMNHKKTFDILKNYSIRPHKIKSSGKFVTANDQLSDGLKHIQLDFQEYRNQLAIISQNITEFNELLDEKIIIKDNLDKKKSDINNAALLKVKNIENKIDALSENIDAMFKESDSILSELPLKLQLFTGPVQPTYSKHDMAQLYEEGLYLMFQDKYLEAAIIFEKIVAVRPKNKAARIRLEECREVSKNV